MPTINLPQKKIKEKQHNPTDNRKLRMEAYNNTQWKKLRLNYLKNNPLCECCLQDGKVTPATDVHHKKSPFKNGTINYQHLLDYDNLMSLCKNCHGNIHLNQQGMMTTKQIIDMLDNLLE